MLIIISIYSLIKENNLIYLRDFFSFPEIDNKLKYFYLITSFILFSTSQIFVYLVIYYISPIIFIMTDIIHKFVLWIINLFDEFDKKYLIFYILGYLIYISACLIINEIIILNFCGLSENTKKFIEKRQKEETKLLNNIENSNNEED